MKILLVEDDKKTAAFIQKGLKEAGYTICHAQDGEEGLCIAEVEDIDLIIADIMLPKLNGLEMIKKIREKRNTIPIIVLSAKDKVDDRITGLETGGDDYLVKPFSFSELLARIHSLLRRASFTPESDTLRVGPLSLDIPRRRVNRDQKEINLTPGEFALLEYLMRNTGRIVSKTMIIEHVWDYNFDPRTNVIEACICRLRDKIDRPFLTKLIHTVKGFGYVIEEKDQIL